MSDGVNMVDDDESSLTSGSAPETWVSQFCEMACHSYFCEVADEFMEDDFNLTGLSAIVGEKYREALELILDIEPETNVALADMPAIQEAGEKLYGLIHARYIITRQGLHEMAHKYSEHRFGTCPRYYCHNMGVLPMGRHDLPGFETVRLYCPCCRDIYLPSNSRYLNIDGAFFGTSFPGMFLDLFAAIEAECIPLRQHQFQLKVFGFKVSEKSVSGPRMKWLRQTSEDEDLDMDEAST